MKYSSNLVLPQFRSLGPYSPLVSVFIFLVIMYFDHLILVTLFPDTDIYVTIRQDEQTDGQAGNKRADR